MDRDRKEPRRHPSTLIAGALIEEINYRTYLQRLEPPLTPEQSAVTVGHDKAGKVADTDATRRKISLAYMPLTRAYLRVLVDLGLIDPQPKGLFG